MKVLVLIATTALLISSFTASAADIVVARLVGTFTVYNAFSPTANNKLIITNSHSQTFASREACETFKTEIENGLVVVSPAEKRIEVFGAEDKALRTVSTLQCVDAIQ